MITGPTFEEMLHPKTIAVDVRKKALEARKNSPLDPVNLYNITWRDEHNAVYHVVLPKALTGFDANIVVIFGKEFPSGSLIRLARLTLVYSKKPFSVKLIRILIRWSGLRLAITASAARGLRAYGL